MFGLKIRSWMENHIVRPRKKGNKNKNGNRYDKHTHTNTRKTTTKFICSVFHFCFVFASVFFSSWSRRQIRVVVNRYAICSSSLFSFNYFSPFFVYLRREARVYYGFQWNAERWRHKVVYLICVLFHWLFCWNWFRREIYYWWHWLRFFLRTHSRTNGNAFARATLLIIHCRPNIRTD